MSIIRVKHNRENPFVQLNKKALWDENLSLKAVGIWARCMSRPDDWTFSVRELIKNCKEGRTSIYGAIDELIEHGYALRFQHYGDAEEGTVGFQKGEYWFFEFPISEEEKLEYADKFKKSLLRSGFMHAGSVHAENVPLLIKKVKEKDINKEYTGKKNYPEKISPAVKETQKEFQSYLNEVLPGRKPMGEAAVKKYLQPLVNRHKKDPDRIKRVLKWIFKSQSPKADFWLPVIQGPKSLYTNFDQIEVQMNRKSDKEKIQEERDARENLIEDNRKWCKQKILSITFPNTQKCMRLEDNCVRVKIGNSIEAISLAEKNMKDILTNKLRGWGFFI